MKQLETISRYKIEKVLGRGAVGTVYKAYDPVINQTVAIKVIHKQLLEQDDSGEQLRRFRNEVLAGRRLLKHPNIVSIYEYGEEQDIAFIIMEFIDGKQLKDFFDEKHKFDLDTTDKIMQQLLAALSFAHKNGVVHRDIKPGNIMVMQNWQIQVADFGIAKIESTTQTQTGMIMGTPNYMSPEQCLGEHVDHRSDIFSAGVILYHLLTGMRPFEAGTMMGTLQQVLKVTPIIPSKLNRHVSSGLDRVIGKALEKNPDDRFQSAEEFAKALTFAMDEQRSQPPTIASEDDTVIMPSTPDTVRPFPADGTNIDTVINTTATKTELIKTQTDSSNYKRTGGIVIGLIVVISTGLYLLHKTNQATNLANLLKKYQCAVLVKNSTNAGKITLSGYAQATDLQHLKDEISQNFIDEDIDYHAVKTWNDVFCNVVDVMNKLQADNETNALGLKVSAAKEDNRYILDDYLEIIVTTPKFKSYLYVDYFQLNGHVLHMYPTKPDQLNIFDVYKTIKVGHYGQEKRWQISPPYGVEMVTVIASSKLLFKELRMEEESTESYLSALQNIMKSEYGLKAAQFLIIETSPQ